MMQARIKEVWMKCYQQEKACEADVKMYWKTLPPSARLVLIIKINTLAILVHRSCRDNYGCTMGP